MATKLQRDHLKGLMALLVAHEPQVHYDQVRPMKTRNLREFDLTSLLARKQGMTMDCSESVTLLCRLAGLYDPNGKNYNGTGYTGDLLAHLPHYNDPSGANTGALVVFGPGGGDHVCMVYEPGADPMLFSHGQERGPILLRLSAEKRAQNPPTTFLSIGSL